MLLLRATGELPLLTIPHATAALILKPACLLINGEYNEDGQPDGSWSWPPGRCLPALLGTAAGYGQFPTVKTTASQPYNASPAFQALWASVIEQQVEEVVQRAVQTALATAPPSFVDSPCCSPPDSLLESVTNHLEWC